VGRAGRERRRVVRERRGVKERWGEVCERVRWCGEKVRRKVGSVRAQGR
jgi:hypothetical protein